MVGCSAGCGVGGRRRDPRYCALGLALPRASLRRQAHPGTSLRRELPQFLAGAAEAVGVALEAAADPIGLANSALTAEEILSAFFKSTLTCHILFSPRVSRNPGMPVMRIPPSTFQYVSETSSSVTPVPRNSCGGFGNIPLAMLVSGSPGRPWQTAQCSL